MRKFLIYVVYLAAAAVIGYGAYFFLGGGKASPEQVLPEGPAFYLQITDLEKNLTRLEKTAFWDKLKNIDGKKLLPKALKKNTEANEDDAVETWNFLLNNFLGKEFAIAVYQPDLGSINFPPRSAQEMGEFTDVFLKNVYLVTSIKPTQKIAETVSGFFSNYGKNLTLSSEKYQNYVIRNALIEDINLSFSFVKIEDLLVFGASAEQIKICIDIYEGESGNGSLADDPDYLNVRERAVETPSGLGFINIEKYLEIAAKEASVKEYLKQFKGFRVLGFSSSWDEKAETDFNFFLDLESMDPSIKSFYDCPSGSNNTLAFTPEEVMLYQWGNCFKAELLLTQMAKTQPKVIEEKLNDYRDQTGVDVKKDIIANLGEELAWYISDIDMKQSFPIPQFMLMLKVKDSETFAGAMQRMLSQTLFRAAESNYSGVTMYSIMSPIGDALSPSYSFIDGFLLMASNQQALKDAISVKQKKSASILDNQRLNEFADIMTGPSRAVNIVDFPSIGKKMNGLVKWVNSFVTARETSYQAFASGAEIRLKDINSRLENQKGEIKELAKKRDELEEKISGNGEDINSQESANQLADLNQKLQAGRKDVEALEEQKTSTETVVTKYRSTGPSQEQRMLWVEKFFMPLSEALQEIVAYIGWSDWDSDDSVLDSMLRIKINENEE